MTSLPTYTADIKDQNMGANPETEDETMMRPRMARRSILRAVACAILIYCFIILPSTSYIRPFQYIHLPSSQPCHPHQKSALVAEHTLVPLEAHIMSKCPDAQVQRKLALYRMAQADFVAGLSQNDGATNYAKSNG